MNRTTSTPISVLRYDVDKDLLLCYGIQHLPFLVVQKIKVEDKSETVYLVIVVVQMLRMDVPTLSTFLRPILTFFIKYFRLFVFTCHW